MESRRHGKQKSSAGTRKLNETRVSCKKPADARRCSSPAPRAPRPQPGAARFIFNVTLGVELCFLLGKATSLSRQDWVLACMGTPHALLSVWMPHPNQAGSLQGSLYASGDILAVNDLGIGSGR